MSFVLIDIAKVRKFLADSKKNARYLSELLRRSGGSATKEVEWGEIVSYEINLWLLFPQALREFGSMGIVL